MNIPESAIQPLVDWCNSPAPEGHSNVVATTLFANNSRDAAGTFTGYLYLIKPKFSPVHFAGTLQSVGVFIPAMSVAIALSRFISVEMFGQLALPDTRAVPAFAETNDFDEVAGPPDLQLGFVAPDLSAPSTGLTFQGVFNLLPTSIVNWGRFNPNKQLGH